MSDERRGYVPKEHGLDVRAQAKPQVPTAGDVYRKPVPGGALLKVQEVNIPDRTVIVEGPGGLRIAIPLSTFMSDYVPVPILDLGTNAAPELPELANCGRASSLATQPGAIEHAAALDKGLIEREQLRFKAVNHPSHYNSHPSGVECITIIEPMTLNVGNAIKYCWRAGLKPGADVITDLEKAVWYLQREIGRLRKMPPSPR